MKLYITPKKILAMTFGETIPKIPEVVYIFFYKSMLKRIEQHFELEKIKFTRGDFYIEKNKKFGIITNFGNGESGALMLAEELSEMGVQRVISIGAVGSLSEDLKIGDAVIIESAFSQSNIGSVYNCEQAEVFTSKDQNTKIKEIFQTEQLKYNLVKTLSVPTIYRETEEEIKQAKQKDISVIEMETFSLALVFSLRMVDFSAIGCVSDILNSEGWSFEQDFKKVFNGLEDIFLKISRIIEK